MKHLWVGTVVLITGLLFLAGCGAVTNSPGQVPQTGVTGAKLKVVATTTLVGDIVKQVGGEQIEVDVLIPPGVDEHGFEPAPKDIASISRADLVFINGAGLEGFIEKLVQNTGEQTRVIPVSDGIILHSGHDGHEHEEEGESHADGDPHVWTDPNNVLIWVDNIEQALISANPDSAGAYRANAESYRQELHALDAWIEQEVAQIPPENRKLVTDHQVFTYFSSRYGFEQVGAVVPGYSTLSSPSAQELAALEDAIRELDVPAVFVGNTVNPATSERVARDTRVELVHILTGSLTDPEGPAPTYIEYTRYNVNAIVDALK